jgi:hypothetical protein
MLGGTLKLSTTSAAATDDSPVRREANTTEKLRLIAVTLLVLSGEVDR